MQLLAATPSVVTSRSPCVCHATAQQLYSPPIRRGNAVNATSAWTARSAVGPAHPQQPNTLQPSPQHRAAYAQQHSQQQQQQLEQQWQQLLLLRPNRPGFGPQQSQQWRRQQQPNVPLLDDNDTRMAAYDQLHIEVTYPQHVTQLRAVKSFITGAGKMRPVIARNLKQLRINRPTPVQGHILPAVHSGRDVLAAGPPGAGTSSAALLAVLSKLLSTPRSVPHNKAMPLALLLVPSRELAVQLATQGAKMVEKSQLTVKYVTGGMPIAPQVIDLRHGADLLIATPGRLMQLLLKKTVSLARLKYLILDDVDELMGALLFPITQQVLHHNTIQPYDRLQTIALGSSALPQQQLLAAAADVLRPSAVVIRASWSLNDKQQQQQQQQQQQPKLPAQQQAHLQQQQVKQLQPQYYALQDIKAQQQQHRRQQHKQDAVAAAAPFTQAPLAHLLAGPAAALVAAATAAASAIPPSVTQRFLGVASQLKFRSLLRLLSESGAAGGGGLVLVFANSHTTAEEVWQQLNTAGVAAGVLHYARTQMQRDEALQCFKYGVTQVLVACGLAYRGLDLPDVAHVINYEVPLSLAEYARRVGTAGRAGRRGVATLLVTPADVTEVRPLVELLKAAGQQVPDWLQALAHSRNGEQAGYAGGSSSRDNQPAASNTDTPGSSSSDGNQQLQAMTNGAASSKKQAEGVFQQLEGAASAAAGPDSLSSPLFRIRKGKRLSLGAYQDERSAMSGTEAAAGKVQDRLLE